MHGVTRLLSQFADDTAAFLKYEAICIRAFTDTLAQVECQIGLKISYEKTTIYRVGSLHKTDAKLYTQKDYNWSDNPIELLGVHIPCDGSTNCEIDFEQVKCKMKKVCKC